MFTLQSHLKMMWSYRNNFANKWATREASYKDGACPERGESNSRSRPIPQRWAVCGCGSPTAATRPSPSLSPGRSDQVDWFDPTTRPLVAPTPRIAWSAWRADTAGLALDSRASLAQRAGAPVTLLPGGAHEVTVDLGAALDGLYGPGTLARGWCARAWLIGGAHPLPSNIVCWPAG